MDFELIDKLMYPTKIYSCVPAISHPFAIIKNIKVENIHKCGLEFTFQITIRANIQREKFEIKLYHGKLVRFNIDNIQRYRIDIDALSKLINETLIERPFMTSDNYNDTGMCIMLQTNFKHFDDIFGYIISIDENIFDVIETGCKTRFVLNQGSFSAISKNPSYYSMKTAHKFVQFIYVHFLPNMFKERKIYDGLYLPMVII